MNEPGTSMRVRFGSVKVALAFLLLIFGSSPVLGQVKKAPRRLAAVHLSDGQVLTGTVLLTPGIDFSLTALPEPGKPFGQVRTFNVDIVKEIAFTPFTLNQELEPERMMQPFKFDEKDRSKRIPTGKPYPVRELACAVSFTSGQDMNGVLASVVLYVQTEDPTGESVGATRKFILKSKQTGESGQVLADLVYVTRIRMLDEGVKIAAKVEVELRSFRPGDGDELSALTRDSLESVPTKPAGKAGLFEVGSTFGENLFLAARRGDRYLVGWPEEGMKPTELFRNVERHVRDLRDYYDERQLLGILPNASGTRVLALVRLRRHVPANAFKGETAGEFDAEGKPMEFFRLSVWLWKRDPESGTMILVKRGSFFRVRVDPKSATPAVTVTQELWPVVLDGDRAVVGK
jgi:hypothetical protein